MLFTNDEKRLLIQAGLHLNSGESAEAVAIYSSLMRTSENQSVLRFRCGLAEYRAGNKTSGIATMESAYNLSDRSTFVALYEGAVFTVAELNDYHSAKELFDRAVSICPDLDPAQYLNHAIPYCIQYYLDDDALDLTRQYTELHPRDYQSWLLRGIALRHTGHVDRAVTSFQESLELNPQHGETWEMLALIAFDGNNQTLLSESLGNARKFSEKLSLAVLLNEVGEYQEAASLYRNLAHESQGEEFFFRMASCLYRNGDFSEAMDAIETALRLAPGEIDSLVIKVRLHLCLGDSQAALQVANRMQELFPNELQGSAEVAGVYYDREDFETALHHVDRAMALSDPIADPIPDLRAFRAVVLARLGRTEDALSECRAALSLDRDCLSALIKTAQILCDKTHPSESEIDEASRCIERAKQALSLKRDLRVFATLRAEASVLAHKGLYAEALAMQKSVVQDPHAPLWMKKRDERRLEQWKQDADAANPVRPVKL